MRPLTSSQVPRKMTKISQKIRLEGLKIRLSNFSRKILSPKAKREREMTLTLRTTGMTSTVQSVKSKIQEKETKGYSWYVPWVQ